MKSNIKHSDVSLHVSLNIRVEHRSAPLPDEKTYKLWPNWVQQSKVRKIKDLPIFPQIHDEILGGQPDSEIARHIHEAGLCLDEELETVKGWVSHYRATVPKALILVRNMPQAAIMAHRQTRESLEIIAEVDQLFKWQKARTERAIKREAQLEYNIPGTEKDVWMSVMILKECQRLREKIGLTDKDMSQAISASNQLERFSMNRVYSREGIDEKLKDPASRIKIMNAVEKMIDLVSRRQETNPEPIKVSSDIIDITPDVTQGSTERKENVGLEVLSGVDLSGINLTAGEEP